jgi:hypothetical protein
VLGGVVEARQQHVQVVGDLRDRLGPLRTVEVRERLGCGEGVAGILGVVDLGDGTGSTRT